MLISGMSGLVGVNLQMCTFIHEYAGRHGGEWLSFNLAGVDDLHRSVIDLLELRHLITFRCPSFSDEEILSLSQHLYACLSWHSPGIRP